MKIKRNGIVYTLSPEEMTKAFLEQQHLFDMEAIKSQIEQELTDEEIENEEKQHLNELLTEDNLDEIAWEKRRIQDKYDVNWLDACFDALNSVTLELYGKRYF